MFYTNAYPSDREANQSLCALLKLCSLAIAGFECYIDCELVYHLYEYIKTIHREPDFVMIIITAYLFGSALKIAVSIYGFYFAKNSTERTPENYTGFFKLLNIVVGINSIIGFLLYSFFNFHIDMYARRYQTLDDAILSTISVSQKVILFQFCAFAVLYVFFKTLYNKELTQPKIVDTLAASIGKKTRQ